MTKNASSLLHETKDLRHQLRVFAQHRLRHKWPWPRDTATAKRSCPHPVELRVRMEIMGSQTYRNVGKSQSVIIMIDPMIATRIRSRHGSESAGGATWRPWRPWFVVRTHQSCIADSKNRKEKKRKTEEKKKSHPQEGGLLGGQRHQPPHDKETGHDDHHIPCVWQREVVLRRAVRMAEPHREGEAVRELNELRGVTNPRFDRSCCRRGAATTPDRRAHSCTTPPPADHQCVGERATGREGWGGLICHTTHSRCARGPPSRQKAAPSSAGCCCSNPPWF
jgi:hypothetical protein